MSKLLYKHHHNMHWYVHEYPLLETIAGEREQLLDLLYAAHLSCERGMPWYCVPDRNLDPNADPNMPCAAMRTGHVYEMCVGMYCE